MPAFQERAPPLRECILTPEQSRYIVRERYLREFLVQTFGLGIDFRISQTKSHRWKYWAPRELDENEVDTWTAELEARRRQDRLQRSATENIGTCRSTNKIELAGARSTWG
ncbi:hypothetical protein JMJ35_002166 [Cladonia borealis]|uniref:Uncharacterized protein n=1 Tax=Cladonia borealis TaxID=184061 RepID=A0AA39R4L9_9LECA|nr:hypothetical protein JMJ35_002166 [Cladonia borealis]